MTNLAEASITARGHTATRPFSDHLGDVINVRGMGALGDGVTDDGPAIQAALDEIRTTGGDVRALYIPAGTYMTGQVLTITNTKGVRIFGDGPEETKIQYTGSATAGNTEGDTGPSAAITPVIMTNGFSYSTLSGMSLVNKAGTDTVGIYFFQDSTSTKGNTDQLRISDLLVYGSSGSLATGYLVGYEAAALCSEIMFENCVVNGATAYGFRNVSSNALNNNLYNCGGVLNAVWCSVPTGSMNVYGASLALNTIDIVAGQNPMVITGCRTESLQFVDAGSGGQCYVSIIGCGQIPGSVGAAYFVNVQNSTIANLIGNYIGSNASNQGKINGDSYVTMTGNQLANATPFSNFTGSIREYHAAQFDGTVSTLPAAGTHFKGVRLFVNNASVAASGNFGAVVAGGGSNTVPVFCDGTDWRIG